MLYGSLGNIYTDSNRFNSGGYSYFNPYITPNIGNGSIYKLEEIDNVLVPKYIGTRFKIPDKFYGKFPFYIKFIWNSFVLHNYDSGIILTGQQGSGKTELAKALCNKALERGIPVLLIEGIKEIDRLVSFLERLDKVVLFFDEFGKNIPSYSLQDKLLTMLSGITGNRKIVILTENNPHSISSKIRNRPGRIRFSKHFEKIEKETLLEYCEENLRNKKHLKKIIKIYETSIMFTFDHIKAIVEELNKHPEVDFYTVIEFLNIEFIKEEKYLRLKRVYKKIDDKEIEYFPITPVNDYKLDSIISQPEFGYSNTISLQLLDPESYKKYKESKAKDLLEYITKTGDVNIQNNLERLDITQNNLEKLTETEAVFKKNNFIVEFEIVSKRKED